MTANHGDHAACSICGSSFPRRQLVSGAIVRPSVADAIRGDHREWSADGRICREDAACYLGTRARSRLESERAELIDRARSPCDENPKAQLAIRGAPKENAPSEWIRRGVSKGGGRWMDDGG